MQREKRIKILARAAKRRGGQDLPLDRDDGQSMADQFLTGVSVKEIAAYHGVAVVRAQRRLFSLGVYQAIPASRSQPRAR